MANDNHLSHARYQQGEWFGVVRHGTVVLLGPETPHALIDTVWKLLASAPEAHEVLHEVTEAFGVSLSRIPPFGIIDSKDALRVFLRGDLELVVQFASGEEQLTGRDVTTWTERRLAAATSYRLRIGSTSSSPLSSLPLREGVVLLSSLAMEAAASVIDEPAPVDEPASVEKPAPVAEQAPAGSTAAGRVSDETMIGYTDSDLGLTIAPAHAVVVPEEAADNGAIDQDVNEDEDAVEEELPVVAPVEHEDAPVHTSTTDPVLPSLENTTNYDHLWDKTVMRNIEDAAVRVDDESDDHDVPSAKAPDASAPGQATAPEPESIPVAHPAEATTGLIDSVPWLRGNATVPPKPDVQPAPQLPAGWPPAPPQGTPSDEDSDHDGQTIMKSSLPTGQDDNARPAANSREGQSISGPSVLARVCSQGHANPPTYPLCSVCGVPLSGDAVQVPRPRLGRMRLSTGELIDLDQSLIIGRQPSVSRVQGGTMPRLVQVESPGGDISRSHVEVRLEGWHVMLCDLKATNGTVLIREGQAPRRLAQSEMAILLDGDIAELGDDISLRFEEIL